MAHKHLNHQTKHLLLQMCFNVSGWIGLSAGRQGPEASNVFFFSISEDTAQDVHIAQLENCVLGCSGGLALQSPLPQKVLMCGLSSGTFCEA